MGKEVTGSNEPQGVDDPAASFEDSMLAEQ